MPVCKLQSSALVSGGLLVTLLITGCNAALETRGVTNTVNAPVVQASKRSSGSVHGGQQPISGATIQLYAASNSGYAATATPLITASSVINGTGTYPVQTDSNGNFSIDGDYTCPSGSYVYLTSTGGSPGGVGGTINNAISLMAALGSCATLQANAATTSIQVNELSTVAGAWALSRFMSSPINAGTSSTNALGLANAFGAVNNLANLATGTAPGTTLPTGATAPVAEINTLANILAACVNTDGAATTGTPCGTLFSGATPTGGTAPSDTLTAALNIAQNPANNVASLYSLSSPTGPFQPQLSSAPSNWLLGIHYTGGGLVKPKGLAVDGSGNVWASNTSSVSELSSAGAPLSPSSGYMMGGLSSPSGIAIDLSGNAWVSNAGNNSVTQITPLGSSGQNFTGGGLNAPSSIAIDGADDVWIGNKGNNSITEMSNSGVALSPNVTGYTGGGLSQPTAITVNANVQPVPGGSLTQSSVTVSPSIVGSVASGFAGLSYEKSNMANGTFQSSSTNLTQLFKKLGTGGILRIGGNSVDTTVWTPTGKGQTSGQVAPADVTALASFLSATQWKVIYGINLENSTPALAAAEADYVANALGSNLVAFEIGNEPNDYTSVTTASNPASFYMSLFNGEANAIEASSAPVGDPQPPYALAGPATSNLSRNIFGTFAASLPQHVSLFTEHYYRGASSNPTPTVQDLVTYPDTSLESVLATIQSAASADGVPYRLGETNSYYDGGASGVSNAYASTLWSLDHMFTSALYGAQGVNFHGGSSAAYSPIPQSGATVTAVNPLYYGLLFFTLAGTGNLLQTSVSASGLNVSAYTIQTSSGYSVVIVNKDPTHNLQVTVQLPQTISLANLTQLTQFSTGSSGPNLSATSGVTIQGQTVGLSGTYSPSSSILPYTLIPGGTQVVCYAPALSSVLIRTM